MERNPLKITSQEVLKMDASMGCQSQGKQELLAELRIASPWCARNIFRDGENINKNRATSQKLNVIG